MSAESSLWKGNSSQWLNLGHYLVSLIIVGSIAFAGVLFPPALVALIFPAAWCLWKFLVVKSQIFELTDERLRITTGVINQKIDEIELYRIKDSALVKVWWMRLTGLATVEMQTSDRSMPHLVIPAIRGGMEMREQLRRQVELQRDRKRVRELDFDEGMGTENS